MKTILEGKIHQLEDTIEMHMALGLPVKEFQAELEPLIEAQRIYSLPTITKKQYFAKHKDFRGVWSSDFLHDTNWNGRKTVLKYIEGSGTCLLIEDVGFRIVNSESDNINPL